MARPAAASVGRVILPARQDAPGDDGSAGREPGGAPPTAAPSGTDGGTDHGTDGTDGRTGPTGPVAGSGGSPSRPAVVRSPTGAELTAAALDRWRTALAGRAGESALSDVQRLGDAQLDLSTAHPSGIAQLFAGRRTRLSNLVREGVALSTAKRRARAVASRAEDHAQRYGLASAFLAIGVATWTEPDDAAGTSPRGDAPGDDDRAGSAETATAERTGGPGADGTDGTDGTVSTVRAPVLLRPVALRPRGRGESDYDLVLEPSLEVNPLLAGALRRRGALLDPAALARGAFTEAGFDPQPALARLRGLGDALLPDFALEDRLLIGTFVHPEQVVVDDLEALGESVAEHEVVRALAGDTRAREDLAHPLPPRLAGDRPLEQERGVGDLDPAQVHVLDAVAAGHHLLVDAPTGSDVAGTLAAVVADAAAAGRTVLHVSGHRRAGDALLDRLEHLGLAELALDIAPDSGWRARAATRLLAAMTVEPVVVREDQVTVVERELVDRRRRLQGYVDGLHRPREPWGASAYDALQALARLTSSRPEPRTRVRLTPQVARALTRERRAQATADLVHAAGLGAFTAATRTSPWYGARLLTAERARAAVDRLVVLLDERLPHVRAEVARVAESTGLTPARTPREWTEQLTMLGEVRHALDLFQPLVFERSAADMVAATATAAWRAEHGVEMSGAHRRRLRRQAKDVLRPGRHVEDLHAALVHVQEQRAVWQAHCPAGGWPRIPEGLAAVEREDEQLTEDLRALDLVLEGTAAGAGLAGLTWAELAQRLERLRADDAALQTLPERTALLENLSRQGLGALLEDLTDRGVPAGVVGAELDLAWWSTVFEEVLAEDPALAGYDGAALAKLVAEFRTLDRRHLRDRAVLALAAARELLRTRMRAADEETQALFAELVEHRFSGVRPAVERYPGVVRHLRPCLVASPALVPQLLPPTRGEDLVILDAAGHLPVETVVPALARARQVLVVGDTRSASGSALAELAAVLPTLSLHADASRRDPHLTAFLGRQGYAGRLTATPLPVTTSLLRLDLVDGSGMPAANGAVEATRAEVDHVVELVVDHALTRPEESLAVVTPSGRHAHAVREAVLAEVRDNPALGTFFAADRAEPFAVVEIGATQGLSREAVILSVGFGRTPHGRVLHRFGPLSEQGGDGRLLEALGATRHRLTLVSCFGADDLDEERLRHPGAQVLADLLRLVHERTDDEGAPGRDAPDGGAEPDRLVLDLAERLWRLGLVVDLHHGVEDGLRLPLVVGHPDLPGEMLVAVLTDDADYVAEPSVRVRDRQAPERLERLGWSVVQVWSAAAFLDPQGEAEAIADVVVEACRRRWAERRAARGPGRPPAPSVPLLPDEPADDDGPAPGSATGTFATTVPAVRGARPAVEPGLPAGAYTDDQLDDLLAWLLADGVPRHDAELAALLRGELGITRRGARIDAVVEAAVRRAQA